MLKFFFCTNRIDILICDKNADSISFKLDDGFFFVIDCENGDDLRCYMSRHEIGYEILLLI